MVAIALGLNAVRLQQNNIRLRMHLKFAFLFSLTIPVGNIFGILLGYTPGHTGRFISAIFQGLAAGTFIHVTFLELIPEELLSDNSDNDCHTEEFDLIEPINTAECDRSTLDDDKGHDLHFTSHDNDDDDEYHCGTVNNDNRHNQNRTNNHRHAHHHQHSTKSTKMQKILLLLLGFLIMTIIPFITEE